jgi:large subunit ribosomal protein L30e
METIDKLPAKKGIIGVREIMKAVKQGKVKVVVFASNCPTEMMNKVSAAGNVELKKFTGDQADLGTRLGKPFPVAMAGYE